MSLFTSFSGWVGTLDPETGKTGGILLSLSMPSSAQAFLNSEFPKLGAAAGGTAGAAESVIIELSIPHDLLTLLDLKLAGVEGGACAGVSLVRDPDTPYTISSLGSTPLPLGDFAGGSRAIGL